MPLQVVPILDGLRWEPNSPNESFAAVGRFAALVLSPYPGEPDEGSVVIFWSGVDHAVFSPPNDEGRHQHALYDAGLDVLLWAGEVIDDEREQQRARHFVILTKEGLAEVHAHRIDWARLSGVTDATTAMDRLGLVDVQSEDDPYPEATVDGFTMGMFVSYKDCGDAWVRAPDGSVATLIWESGSPSSFVESIPPEPTGRWGTYAVRLDLPLTDDDEAAAYLRALLPELEPRWRAWARERAVLREAR